MSEVRTLEIRRVPSTAAERLSTTLLALFAALAVALAVVGLCGVTSYLVEQRTQEIGVRMALGASRRHVMRLVFREGMAATAAGIALGLAGAAAATRVIQAMLFGVSAWNPLAFAAGPAILAAGAVIGIWFPAGAPRQSIRSRRFVSPDGGRRPEELRRRDACPTKPHTPT